MHTMWVDYLSKTSVNLGAYADNMNFTECLFEKKKKVEANKTLIVLKRHVSILNTSITSLTFMAV